MAVIVTGGGYGIGRALACLLTADGEDVVVFDAERARGEETIASIGAAGGRGAAVTGNVTDFEAARACCTLAVERFGALRGLANCAAMRHPGKATEITEAQWDETVDVCLKGTFLFCKAALPYMIGAGGGAIVNVSGRPRRAPGRRREPCQISALGRGKPIHLRHLRRNHAAVAVTRTPWR